MGFARNLRELREKQGLSQEQLAEKLNIPRSTITHYENSKNNRLPRIERLKLIAEFFKISVDDLLSTQIQQDLSNATEKFASVPDGIAKKSLSDLNGLTKNGLITVEMVEVPVYRLDVNGEEIFADYNIIGRHYVPAEQMDCICFKVPDDSMSGSGLYTDYIVTVRKQSTAEDGQVVIVKTRNGFCIRRVRYFNDEVLLDPDNPRYQSERININDLDIIGVVTDASFKVK